MQWVAKRPQRARFYAITLITLRAGSSGAALHGRPHQERVSDPPTVWLMHCS